MRVRDRARGRCLRSVLGIAPPHGVRYPAEAQALDRLPDADILCALHDLPDEQLANLSGIRMRLSIDVGPDWHAR